jgi:hypothetical protein
MYILYIRYIWYMGAIFLRCTKILSQHHFFLSFLPSPFKPCKDIFMDDYDGNQNCKSLKYIPSKSLITFDSLFFMGIKI